MICMSPPARNLSNELSRSKLVQQDEITGTEERRELGEDTREFAGLLWRDWQEFERRRK